MTDWEKDLPPIARERLAKIGELTAEEKAQLVDSQKADSLLAQFFLGQLDPVTYAPYISPRPVWMINGRQDFIVPPAAAQALQDAARDPKKVLWYDGGHMPPIPLLVQFLTEWFDQALDPAVAASGQPGAEPAEDEGDAEAEPGQA